MRTTPGFVTLLIALLPACGGGGSGGGPDPPPPPPYARTISTGLAIAGAFGDIAALDPWLLVPVSEIEMGADLNGDGDQLDRVLHRVDTTSDGIVNLGLACIGPVLASDAHFAFLVPEGAQAATDLNADGDAADAVWFVYDPARPAGGGNPINTGLATPGAGLPGAGTAGGFVLLHAEAAGGADLNGDGDLLDHMATVFDGATFLPGALVVGPHATGTPLVARAGRVLFASSEPAAGIDLNGDGDALDTVLGVVDFTAGLPAFFPVGFLGGRAVAGHPYALTDNGAVYLIDEASDGATDLNGDADANDAILAVFDIAGGTGEVTPAPPAFPAFAMAVAPSFGLATGPRRALVGISEAAQGNRDLNGDMDTVDVVAGWVDTGALTKGVLNLVPLPIAPVPLRIDGTNGLFAVSETGMGAVQGVDLNGDLDTTDSVVHAIATVPGGGTVNLGFAVADHFLTGTDSLLAVSEAADAGIDRNGDADANDVVLVYADLAVSPPATLGLGVVAAAQTLVRAGADDVRIALILREGQSPAFDDMNNDGDDTDTGLVLLRIDASVTPPVRVAPTPFFAGTAGIAPMPPIAVGTGVFAFATSEVFAGADLDGDGDATDTVLRYARITPPPDTG